MGASRPSRESADDDADLTVAKGWGGYRRVKAAAPSKWTKIYKVSDDEGLVMFLEDGPYASFLVHWCDWLPKGQKQNFICLQDDCPLDDVDTPSARIRFNVLDCRDATPVHTTFECGVTITDTLDDYAKKNPLSGSYWAVAMRGQKRNRRTEIRPVKVRDLEEDWDFTPLTEEQISRFDAKLWDDTALERSTREELQEVADAATE